MRLFGPLLLFLLLKSEIKMTLSCQSHFRDTWTNKIKP